MIRQMSESSVGTPSIMFSKKAQENYLGEHTKSQEDLARKKWKNVLETIAQALEIEKGISNTDIFDIGLNPDDGALKRANKHCEEFDIALLTDAQRRIRKRGWKYLQRYFHNLWD